MHSVGKLFSRRRSSHWYPCIRFGQVREIPLFHGDQWEATVPSLLGLAPEDTSKGLDKDGQVLGTPNPGPATHPKLHGDPARTRLSTPALLIVRCTLASRSAAAHGCQTCGAKSAPGDVTSQAPLSCRRVCRTRRTTGKRCACPSPCAARFLRHCHGPVPTTQLHSPFLSRLPTGGSGHFHRHHRQPSKFSRAVPDESLAIFNATPRPVRFPCPPCTRKKRSQDLARALLAIRPITLPESCFRLSPQVLDNDDSKSHPQQTFVLH